MIKFSIPIRTINPLNGAQGRTRGAVFAKAARRKKEREAAMLITTQAYRLKGEALDWGAVEDPEIDVLMPPWTLTLTRLSSGKLDGDGLQAALKSVRDGVADALGINDGSDAVVWRYEQKKCRRGAFGVEVTIE